MYIGAGSRQYSIVPPLHVQTVTKSLGLHTPFAPRAWHDPGAAHPPVMSNPQYMLPAQSVSELQGDPALPASAVAASGLSALTGPAFLDAHPIDTKDKTKAPIA